MVRPADVDRLLARAVVPGSPVLTVYLNVDRSQAPNLNRGFVATLRTCLRELESRCTGPERDALAADASRVLRFLEGYEPAARTLIVVCDDSAGLFWTGELHVPLATDVRWNDRPYVRPLLELLDAGERYGVVLTDKERARVFTVFLGEVEEEHDAFAAAEVRHKQASGTDHWRSQTHFQRQDDMHVRQHLKRVAALADDLSTLHRFDRLVLAGPVEATSTLEHLLPKRLRSRMVATVRLPIDASPDVVLRETLPLEERAARDAKGVHVDALLTAAGKGDGGGVGLEPTLTALQEGRVWRLIYADGYAAPGGECPRCGALSARERGGCAYCGAEVRRVDDLVDRAGARVVGAGGRMERVGGEAALRLRDAGGGIGGLLRF